MPESTEKIRPGLEKESESGLKEVIKRDEKIQVPREVSSWLKQIELQQPNQNLVINDQKQPPTVSLKSDDTGTKIKITRTVFGNGFKRAVTDAGRWLSVFVFRLIKMKKGKVVFKDENV